jgi:hypothetical protein
MCNYIFVAEEAIVYWLFVSEEEGWFSAFEQKWYVLVMGGDDTDEVDNSTGRTQHPRCGTHKTQLLLKHWWQLKAVYKAWQENRVISKEWDAAWMKFAAGELEMKNNKKGKRKQKHVDVCLHMWMFWELHQRNVLQKKRHQKKPEILFCTSWLFSG